MNVPVRWVLDQQELALRLKAGRSGLSRPITFVLTTELPDPGRWLSGGELVLTTGIRLPVTAVDRAHYLRALADSGVAAVGFGTGLSHPTVPTDLVAAADELELPLLEVPLPTPFAAVAKRVMGRLAEQEYEAVLRASRAQPKMTRAVIRGGARATVHELAAATSSTVLVLDPAGGVLESHPSSVGQGVLTEIRSALDGPAGAASSGVSVARSGTSITIQQISVDRAVHGYLVVVSAAALNHVEQILLGHATSLLALDFEKPARLSSAQNRLNSNALGLLLSDVQNLEPAWAQVANAADTRGAVRALTARCATPDTAAQVESAIEEVMSRTGRALFLRRHDTQVTVLLRGDDDTDLARSLLGGLTSTVRKSTRVGLSGTHPVNRLVEAIEQARLAASAAESGAAPLTFSSLTGRALLSFSATREVLDAMADTMIAPLADYDLTHGTALVASLRAFLESNGHWESAADRLGVHRHTLRNRIVRIESLLGCSLDVARVRAELLLAIIARES